MPLYLLNPWMLIGLAALAVPVVIHLLNRRRYDVVDWGAMQFLQISNITRRRIMLEEILLMMLRMALLAVLVLGLAAPVSTSQALRRFAPRPSRDVVFVIDGSAGMGSTATGATPHEAAKEWVLDFVNQLSAGDGVAVLLAKQQVVPIIPELSHDLARVRENVAKLPMPAGGCDWPAAVEAANSALAASTRLDRDIVLLTDGQRYGWADQTTMLRWEMVATQLELNKPEEPGSIGRPRMWVVNVDPNRPADPPNWSLAPLRGNRPVVPVNREVTFHTELDLHGQKQYSAPYKVSLDVDGKQVRDLEVPRAGHIDKGKVPLAFSHRFGTAGSHLISVVLQPDPPPAERPAGYVIKDHVPGDNRQDYAVEVLPALPVLLVDGDPTPGPRRRSTDFLRDALSPARDPNPAVKTRIVTTADLTPAALGFGEDGAKPAAKDAAEKPRVLVLCDVPRLSTEQAEAVGRFLADGGGVLVTLGDRVDANDFNARLYREGKGWLPARLDGPAGDPAKPREGARPVPAASTHPAFELFRTTPAGGLDTARFPRWWKLATPGRSAAGIAVAMLRSGSADFPFLVERAWQAGRVIVSAVPFDASRGTNLPDLPAFVPLAHELIYYLAGARASEFNLQAGQPIRLRLDTEGPLEGYFLTPPSGETKPLSTASADPATYPAQLVRQARGSLLICENTRETGIYRVQTPDGDTVYYVVQPDGQESDLTPCSDEDREHVAKVFNPLDLARAPLQYETERALILSAPQSSDVKQEVWWCFLLGLVGLLCAEVWMTRRLVMNR
jgi:von Willebrand factor type A domain/Aerotolerance regulator N-terminal